MLNSRYEELDRLFKTPCRHDVLRRVSIFAVLSGLRRGDILALDWKDYERDNKGKPTFRIVTKKTGAVSLIIPFQQRPWRRVVRPEMD